MNHSQRMKTVEHTAVTQTQEPEDRYQKIHHQKLGTEKRVGNGDGTQSTGDRKRTADVGNGHQRQQERVVVVKPRRLWKIA